MRAVVLRSRGIVDDDAEAFRAPAALGQFLRRLRKTGTSQPISS